MDFYSVRELRTSSRNIWDSLSNKGEVVITNNGKPSVLMLDISSGNMEELLRAVKQAQLMISVNRMRKIAANSGFMTDEEINAEIQAARKEIDE
ncbi:MAG: type II toxin-antitoxin system Phd/YefM family antitoxin [Oscillospiraceae bacterium]|nr:type II toxin-antitoxin system Phd/YefM family antitoxin [Oscillospiraceae bacterium]